MSAPSPDWQGLAVRLSPAVGRTRGEWIADLALFTLACFVVLLTAVPANNPQITAWWWPLDIALGLLSAVLIWWTRRYPLVVGIAMIGIGAVALTATAGVLVSVYRMGLLAPVRPALIVTALQVAIALPYHAVAPLPGISWATWLATVPLMYTLSLCIGLLGRARRQVIIGLRQAAERERERSQESVAAARREEREQIAREMHDVLAHRISLLSMHAGALEYRAASATPPDPDELRQSAQVIRASAHGAVEDLRELLGLLRSDDELGRGAPQPKLADLAGLVAAAQAAGQHVELDCEIRPERLRETTQRTAYRVVQEALTNARKHAPQARVTVRLRQDDDRLQIVVANPLSPGVTLTDLPPPGNGLIGLDERVRIDGGSFSATVEAGLFVVRAELPLGGLR